MYEKSDRENKSLRLKGYDYTQAGIYFITINVERRKHWFGSISKGVVNLSDIGEVAKRYLQEIPQHFPATSIDAFIIMPDHVHLLLVLADQGAFAVAATGVATSEVATPAVAAPAVAARHVVQPQQNMGDFVGSQHVVIPQRGTQCHIRQFGKPLAGSVSVIIQQYKASVKRWCNQNRHSYFQWQSRFHDKIIRTPAAYQKIKDYIAANPRKWKE